MSPFGLKFSQMILHTETSKTDVQLILLFVVLHKPTLTQYLQYSCNHILWIVIFEYVKTLKFKQVKPLRTNTFLNDWEYHSNAIKKTIG